MFHITLVRQEDGIPQKETESPVLLSPVILSVILSNQLTHGPLPADADEDARWFAADLLAVIKERVAAENYLAAPYSLRFGAGRRGWPTESDRKDKKGNPLPSDQVKKVGRILTVLVDAGTFCREQMRPKGQSRGTYAYSLPVSVFEAWLSNQELPAFQVKPSVAASNGGGVVPKEVGVLGVKRKPGAEGAD